MLETNSVYKNMYLILRPGRICVLYVNDGLQGANVFHCFFRFHNFMPNGIIFDALRNCSCTVLELL